MDRFHLMNVFVAVAEESSFAAAARRLGMSPPAVTRAIATLEERLGVKLLTRTTRWVRTTSAGMRYLASSKQILQAADEADEIAAGALIDPQGELTLTAPVIFGRIFVMPAILRYLQRYPQVSICCQFLDRVVNLIEEGFDVAIRIGGLADSSMNAIKVGSVRRIVCAAPQYLQHHGIPQTPEELKNHKIISANSVTPTADWKFDTGRKTVAVKIQPTLMVNNNDAAIIAALQGFGITCLMSYQIASFIAAGQLQTVLEDYAPPLLPIHVLHFEGRQTSAKVRTFVDHMAYHLREEKVLK